ncbi:MAG: GGDEF domain-containing protein [Spirochaetaceae bacterium]
MDLFIVVDINFFSIGILIILLFALVYSRQHLSISNRIFIVLIASIILMLFLESLLWYTDGKTGDFSKRLNEVSHFVFFSLNPLVPAVWLVYIDYKVVGSLARLKRRIFASEFVIIAIVFMIINIKTGWFYSFNNNLYQRGPYSIFIFVYLWLILLASIPILIKNKRSLDTSIITSYFFFTFFPICSVLFQTYFMNTLLIWNSAALACLATFVILELRNLSKDFLTGLSTRRELELWIINRLRNPNIKKTFAVIVIDLNDFKEINDNFGHKEGDEALKIFSNIINILFKKKDIVGRYGGDEFLIIVDSSYELIIEKAINRISTDIEEYNNKEIKPYKLKFSAGAVMYDPNKHSNYKELIHDADSHMYKVKRG